MEIPMDDFKTRRVKITDRYNGAEVVILPFRQTIHWVQAAVYLAFFGIFSYFVFVDKSTSDLSGKHGVDVLFAMYGIIIIALIVVGYALWWTIKGKEVVTITDGVLTIEKVNALEKIKRYDLSLATNFRAEEEVVRRGRNFARVEGYAWQVAVKGTIKFDYDVVNIVQFGDWLSGAEANYILDRLRAKKLIV